MQMKLGVLFLLLLGFCVTQAKVLDLILLPEAARKDGAVCLDGSPPGIYYREGMVQGCLIKVIQTVYPFRKEKQ